MQEENPGSSGDTTSPTPETSGTEQPQRRRRRAASRPAGPPVADPVLHDAGAAADTAVTGGDAASAGDQADAAAAPAKKTARKMAAKKTAAKKTAKKAPAKKATARKSAAARAAEAGDVADAGPVPASGPQLAAGTPATAQPPADAVATATDADGAAAVAPAESAPAPRKRSRSRKAAAAAAEQLPGEPPATTEAASAFAPSGQESAEVEDSAASAVLFQPPSFPATPLFAAPDPEAAQPVRPARSGRRRAVEPDPVEEPAEQLDETETTDAPADTGDAVDQDDEDGDGTRRRRRRRGGRGRRRKADDGSDGSADQDDDARPDADDDSAEADDARGDSEDDHGDSDEGGSRRRRRRRRRRNDDGDEARVDDPPNTVVRVREARELDDEVTSVKGSTRLEAKKQRRREGREAGRRRPPILSEAEFLARREAVDRVMAVRQSADLTQIAVLEDDVLVEHYVSRTSQQSLIGNVYLGRVQNVLPAMEAAFVDIGRGRNAVLYAGEVDWTGLGKDGPKRIEEVLKSGQPVLVQVTKDPIGHKGARLTSQVSLPGRYVVYVPRGSMNGISRKLPDTERTRLKKILKQVVPEDAGVIVRTAAEGASEEELTNDVGRLQAEWEALSKKATTGNAPQLLHGEPDLAIKVVRDLFNEDFTKLVVSGDRVWDTIDEYVSSVAGSLRDRVEKWTGTDDVFAAYRIDEQIAKAMDRKVWLPSGGSLVIDRTEAMTVVDVNTGKFTGSGGNLEETVTKNNLEAAEEIVRQLRLRDIGGIIVVDFIDMVLEANRDLVLRRLVECLGRDRTKHQVAEVTSLGLVQMTRKRIGTGLLEAFSEPCPHCKGRGLLVHAHPVESGSGSSNGSSSTDEGRSNRSERRGRRRKTEQPPAQQPAEALAPKLEALASPGQASPADLMPVGGNGADAQDDTAPGAGEAATDASTADAPTADAPTTGQGPATSPPPPPPPPATTAPAETLVTGAAAAESDATGQPAGEPAEPSRPRRTRRRAQRPAGSPVS